MPLWMIEAVIRPDDPAWMDRPRWKSVVVRASSPAFARLVAKTLEPPKAVGNESPSHRTVFDDEKLYWVKPYEGTEWPEQGSDKVLATEKF
jgi:hypothetical protein